MAASTTGREQGSASGGPDRVVMGEPSIEELLSDKITNAVLTRDGLKPDHVRALLAQISRRRRQVGLEATSRSEARA